MHLACCEGQLGTVKWLVNEGANQFVKDIFGNKPIDDAIRYNHKHIVNFLKFGRNSCGDLLSAMKPGTHSVSEIKETDEELLSSSCSSVSNF